MRKKYFFILPFYIFLDFERKIFETFGQKTSTRFQKLPSTCPEEQFVVWNFFLKFWIVLDFCRNLRHGSQNSIYVSRVKIAEETVFLFFFSEFFRILSENFRTSGQKTSRICQNYLLRVQRDNLWLDFFKKKKNFEPFWLFYRNFWHGSQNSIYVSRVKFAEEITFSFFFSEFFRFLSENFQTFGQKTSKTCENYLLRVHRNNL